MIYLATQTIDGQLGAVDSSGNLQIIYPITKAKNVQLEDGTDLETYLSNLNTTGGSTLPVNPSEEYKATAGAMWIEA